MTLEHFTVNVDTAQGLLSVDYYKGVNVVSVILCEVWTRETCDEIRNALKGKYPTLPVVFGKELGKR
jgi:hypothetical protein